MNKNIPLVLGLALLVAPMAWGIPQVLNFQGRLSESGLPASGSRTMTFGVFQAASGGAPLFTETRAVAVSTGIFNVLIGETTPGGIPVNVFDGADKFIEVQVGAQTLPRQRIASVAYAFRSQSAASVDGAGAITVSSVTTSVAFVDRGVKIGHSIVLGTVNATLGAPNTIAFDNGDGTIATINPQTTGGTLTLATVGTKNIVLSPGGNVGVGTAAPSAKLEVAGSIEYTSKTVVRFTRTSVLSSASDAVKDAQCAAERGPDYVAAALGELTVFGGPHGNYHFFTGAGNSFLWDTSGETLSLLRSGSTTGNASVACVHKNAPFRFTRTSVPSSATDGTKDAQCALEFGTNYMAAMGGDLAFFTLRGVNLGGTASYAIVVAGSVGTCLSRGTAVSCNGGSGAAVVACVHN